MGYMTLHVEEGKHIIILRGKMAPFSREAQGAN